MAYLRNESSYRVQQQHRLSPFQAVKEYAVVEVSVLDQRGIKSMANKMKFIFATVITEMFTPSLFNELSGH